MTRTNPIRFLNLAGAVIVASALVGTSACHAADTKAKPAIVYTDSEKKAAEEFEKRVADHASLQKKLEGTLPALPDKATPEQLEQPQTSLRTLLKKERTRSRASSSRPACKR